MKKLLLIGSCLVLSLMARSASAAVIYWDPLGTFSYTGNANGYAVDLSQTWENKKWSTASGGTATAGNFVEGDAAVFSVGSGKATPAFTITMNAPHTVAGFFDGSLSPNSSTVTISGTGSVILQPANLNGFATDNSSDGALGYITFNVPLTGGSTAGIAAEDTSQVFMNAANTFSGGTYLGYTNYTLVGSSKAPDSLMLMNFNNSASFGTGPIYFLYCLGGALVAEGSSAITIPNPVINYQEPLTQGGALNTVLCNIVGVPAANGGVTFSGPWTLSGGGGGTGAPGYTTTSPLPNYAPVAIGSGGVVGDLVTISGTVTGTNNFYKYGVGILAFSGVDAMTGNLAVSNGVLAVTGAGQLNGSSYAGNITNLTVFSNGTSASQTFSGIISGAGSINQGGSGTLALSGLNTYTGITTNSGGTLQVASTETPGASGPLGASAAVNPGSIVMSGGTLQYSAANHFDYSGRFSTAANQAYKIDANGQAVVFNNAALSSAGGSLTVSSTAAGGTLTLGATETYSGATTVNSGTLFLGIGASINNSSSLAVNAGGTFDVTAVDPYVLSASTALNASANTSAVINDSGATGISLGSQPVNITFTPTNPNGDSAHAVLTITAASLSLGGNVFTVNNNFANTPLGAGTYVLINVPNGNITDSGSHTVVVTGAGLAAGATASISSSANSVNLVVTAGQPVPLFSGLTASQAIPYGTPTITLAGNLGFVAGSVYPASGETFPITIDGNTQNATFTDSLGNFTCSYNSSTLPANATAYTIIYQYNGDATLNSVTNTSTALTVNKRSLTVTATGINKIYDATTTATVTLSDNRVNSDVFTETYASAAFANAAPATGIAVNVTGISISGAGAANYSLANTTAGTTANITSPSATWNGLDFVNNPDWSDGTNWLSGSAPDLGGDSVDFGGTVGLVPVMDQSHMVYSLTFDSTAGSFILTNSGGTVLTVDAGGLTDSSANPQNISMPVTLGTAFSSPWSITSGGSVTSISNVSDIGAGLTLSGTGTLSLMGSNNAITGPLTNLASTLEIGGTAKLNNGSYAAPINNTGTLIYNSTSNQTLSGVISGAGALTQNGTGTLTLSGVNTYAGMTTIGNGSLTITNDINLGTAPATAVASQLTMNCAIVSGTNYNDYGLRFQTTSGALNANRGVYLGPLGGSMNCQSGITLTNLEVISGPGAFYASPNASAGYGTIMLSALNTYTGPTIIAAGTLTLGVNGALPSGTPLTIGSSFQGAANGSFFNMNSKSQTIGPLASNPGFGAAGLGVPTVQLTGALTVIETNGPTTFAGVISSAGGSLTINGNNTGELLLAGTNTYTGATTINTGAELGLTGTGAISNTPSLTIAAGGTFDVSTLTSTTFFLSSSTILNASGAGTAQGTTAAAINGASGGIVNLGSQPINLNYTPASSSGDPSDPALDILQGALTFNNNQIVVSNTTATPMGAGTYTLIQVTDGTTGVINGAPLANVTVIGGGNGQGSGLAAGAAAGISVVNSTVVLTVTTGGAATTTTTPAVLTYGTSPSATVTPIPDGGEVQFFANGAALGSPVAVNTGTGVATLLSPILAAGSYSTFTAVYSGSPDGSSAASTSASETLVVNPAPLTVTANNQTANYGTLLAAANGAGSTLFTSSGLQYAQTIGSVTLTTSPYTTNTPAGTYTGIIVPSAATGGTFSTANYTITYANGTLTVNKVALTVTASAESMTYGSTYTGFGTLKTTNFTTTGLVNGNNNTNATVTLTCPDGTPTTSAGTYANAIVPSALAAVVGETGTGTNFNPANYTITYANGTFTVNPAALRVGAKGQTNVYGSVVTPLVGSTAFTNGAMMNSETIGSVTLIFSSTNVGTNLTITPTNAVGGSGTEADYTITYVTNTLVVTNLPVVLTGIRAYDGTATAASTILSVSNKVGSDNVTVASGTATLAGSAVGTQAITVLTNLTLGGTTATNYTLTNASGSVVITNPFNAINPTSSLDITGTNFVVCWASVPGVTYTVLTNVSLDAPQVWASAGTVDATATSTCFTLPGGITGNTNVNVVIKQQ